MAVDPEKRFPTAAAMGDEIRGIVGTKMIAIERVAMHVKTTAGERVARRLEALVDASAKAQRAPVAPVAIEPAPPPPPPPHRATLPTPPPLRNSEPLLREGTIAVAEDAPPDGRASRARVVVLSVVAACVLLLGVAAWRFTNRAEEVPTPSAAPVPIPQRASEPETPSTTSAPTIVQPPPAPAPPSDAPSSDAPPAATAPSASARPRPTPTIARPPPRPPPTSPWPRPKFDPTNI
jgi:hypothetical protein